MKPAKCVIGLLELNWFQRFGDNKKKNENLSLCTHVIHLTAKWVISRRGENENGSEMYKNENCTCRACKGTFFSLLNMIIVVVVA